MEYLSAQQTVTIETVLSSILETQGLLREGSHNSYCLAITRLETTILLADSIPLGLNNTTLINLLESALDMLTNTVNNHQDPRLPGRPKIQLSEPQLEYLISMRFSVTKIAQYYKVSRYTIMRRMREFNLSVTDSYSTISDGDLGSLISSILGQFPNSGYKRMKGYLQARNVKVTDGRVRAAMRTVDPDGVYMRTLRRNQTIRRRTYYVQFSNQLLHIDGNLKLIRWGIVIRCGIDGKSRTATYVSATNNNRSDTHLNAFLTGVRRYGVPLRCRSDKGGENVLIAKFMIDQRGAGRGSHICGRSVHNQRIERFWRDVFEGCTSTFYNLFWRLEDDGILDIDNSLHLWILQFVFLPRLNFHLSLFIEGWNSHPLSTEMNQSPHQLMLMNLPPQNFDLLLSADELADAEFLCDDLADLGRFDDIANQDYFPGVEVINGETMGALSNLDLTRNSESFGYDIFVEALRLVYRDTRIY